MTSFDPKNPRDIDYLFDWNKFKPELVGDLPPKYHKEVIENFDLQKFFLIKSQEVEFVKVLFGFPSVGVQSMKTRDFKLNKFFKNYDDFYAQVKSTITETQNCIKTHQTPEDGYKQCLVESRKKFDEIFDQCLGFYDQELPYVNPLMKKFAS